MITGKAVAPLEACTVTWSEHEGAALLDRISSPRSLSEPAREGRDALPDTPRVERPRPAVREPRRPERAERWIGEERSFVSGGLAERRDVLGLAATHDHHLGATRVDVRQRTLEPSHLLAAEDSAEVADEGEHHGLRRPQTAESDGRPALVEDGERGEPVRQLIAHAGHGI